MKIVLSGTMLRYTNYNRKLEVDAPNIPAAIDHIATTYPSVKKVLLDGTGRVRSVHRLFLNSQMISETDMERPLNADDQLDIITAVAGG